MDLSIKRTFLKNILIMFQVGADNLTSTLSPVLGQYGINVQDFIQKLNVELKFLSPDVTVRVYVTLYSNSTYNYSISYIGISDLARFLREPSTSVTPLELFKVVQLFTYFQTHFSNKDQYANYLNLRGYLSSFQ